MTQLNFEAVFGLDRLEHEQEKARVEEERAREEELKEILARELPEDLLDDLSDTSSEVSEITEDPTSQLVGVPTHHLRVEGLGRNTSSRQQPDSQSRLMDEQFFHSSQILVSTPHVGKEVYSQETSLSSHLAPGAKDSVPPAQESLSQTVDSEELLRLRILNDARSSEIRSLQSQMQQLQSEYELQVSQLSEELRQLREEISVSCQQVREYQTEVGLSQSQLSELETKLSRSEQQCEALRGENRRMSEELHNALTHLDNCKIQLETLCKTDVIDRLRVQHLSMIQQSQSDHLAEVRDVRDEMEAVTFRYQETIRQMDRDILQQKELYTRQIECLNSELEEDRCLLEQLRVEVSESELRCRVEGLQVELSESRVKETELEDEKRQLELMLEGVRMRCSEAERETQCVSADKEGELRELREKLNEGENERKESLEKCRAACLQLHEESCNRLRQKSAQEERLLKDLHQREKEKLSGEVERLQQGLSEREERLSSLETAVSEKEMLIRRLEGQLAVGEENLRNVEMQQEVNRRGDESRISKEVLEEQMEARGVWRYQNELRNQWYEWKSTADRDKRELTASHDIVLRKYQHEISHLKEHISHLENELSTAISLHKSQHELVHSASEERMEMYNYTLEAIHNAFQEVLNSHELSEALPTPLDLPLAEYTPTGTTQASEFPSLLSDYLRHTLFKVLQPLCADKKQAVERIDSEQNGKVQQAVTLALHHAKQQYLKSFSDLKASLNAKFSEKISGLNETWEQERVTLSGELDVSREACQELKRRVRRCEEASEVGMQQQVEQLSLLQQKISDTDTDAEMWLQERVSLNEELERSKDGCQQLLRKLRECKLASEKEKQQHLQELSLLRQEISDTQALHQEHVSLSEELETSKETCRQLKRRLRESELAAEREKKRQTEQMSLLRDRISSTDVDADNWQHERVSLNEELERSRETCVQLKNRLRECEIASEKEKKKQMEQLSRLKHKISDTELSHKKSVQSLEKKFKKQIKETRDTSCQADSADKRYKELFERSLNNLRRETEGLMKKKLAIVEEARLVEFENAKKMVENNEHFLRCCKQVINSGKKQTIDYHSSI